MRLTGLAASTSSRSWTQRTGGARSYRTFRPTYPRPGSGRSRCTTTRPARCSSHRSDTPGGASLPLTSVTPDPDVRPPSTSDRAARVSPTATGCRPCPARGTSSSSGSTALSSRSSRSPGQVGEITLMRWPWSPNGQARHRTATTHGVAVDRMRAPARRRARRLLDQQPPRARRRCSSASPSRVAGGWWLVTEHPPRRWVGLAGAVVGWRDRRRRWSARRTATGPSSGWLSSWSCSAVMTGSARMAVVGDLHAMDDARPHAVTAPEPPRAHLQPVVGWRARSRSSASSSWPTSSASRR